MRLYVAGLFGCTSVVIISETGVWFSHHWESPSFLGDDSRFEREVLSTIGDGDPDDLARMPGAFSLAEGSGILSANSNVQIFISTPKNPDDGKELFEARVDKIVDLLTGEGKPWAGITPIRRGYVKSKSERERDQFALRANSKVLIEYDNNQNAAFGKEPKPNQQAIYRVWLEQQKFEHQWDAKVGIQKMQLVRTLTRNVRMGVLVVNPLLPELQPPFGHLFQRQHLSHLPHHLSHHLQAAL